MPRLHCVRHNIKVKVFKYWTSRYSFGISNLDGWDYQFRSLGMTTGTDKLTIKLITSAPFVVVVVVVKFSFRNISLAVMDVAARQHPNDLDGWATEILYCTRRSYPLLSRELPQLMLLDVHVN